jgi:serine/threonine-protein kinase
MARASGEVLRGRYRLGPPLGEGATGTVLRASDSLLRRDVAVKLLKPAFAQDPTLVARFYAEARAAAALVDPHVVGIHDVLSEDDVHAIVMEFVDGPSLARVLRERGPLGEVRAIAYGRQIARALAAAHARGLLHRDIKPANVLLAPGDTVKVTDFGLAKALEGNGPDLTEAGRLVGSAAYFSPEQAQGLPLGPAADLYSLGVLLYELVTGRLPFEADSPVSLAVAHVTTPPPDEATLRRSMSPGLAAIVHRLLQKDPNARFPSANAAEAALAALAPQTADGAQAHVAPPTDPPAAGVTATGVTAAGAIAAGVSVASVSAAGVSAPTWDTPTLVSSIPIVPPPTRRVTTGAAGNGTTSTNARPDNPARPRTSSANALAARVLARARTAPVMLAAGVAILFALLGVAWAAPHRSVRPAIAVASGTNTASTASAATAHAANAGVVPAVTHRSAFVTVPNLLGMNYAAAGHAMRQLSLRPNFAARMSDATAESVLAQYPAAGTRVQPGTTAMVIISTGPRPAVDLRDNTAYLKLPPGQRGRGHGHGRHGHGHGHHGGEGDGGDGGD